MPPNEHARPKDDPCHHLRAALREAQEEVARLGPRPATDLKRQSLLSEPAPKLEPDWLERLQAAERRRDAAREALEECLRRAKADIATRDMR